MPLIPFLDRYYRRENNNDVGLGRKKKLRKLATLKSNWEGLDWRELGYSEHLCSATNHSKSQGTKKRAKALKGRKTVPTLGCTIQALSYLSAAMLGFLLPSFFLQQQVDEYILFLFAPPHL